MATIASRKRVGGIRYTAQIRIRRNGGIVHSESRTFSKKSMAAAWAKAREVELEKPGALEPVPVYDVSVGDVMTWYQDFCEAEKGSTKHSQIRLLSESTIAGECAVGIAADVVWLSGAV